MKVRALRKFWMDDKIRGTMIEKNNGDVFEMDEAEEGETIFGLFGGGRITVIDEKFLPMKGTYRAVHGFSYKTEDGFPRMATAGKEISLAQEVACQLLTTGFIRRLDDNEWSPKKLLQSNMKSNEPKVMFDKEPAKTESWIRGRR